MRVLLISGSHPESAWLFKALHESAHSLQRVDELRDGIFLAGQEIFDAVIVMSSEAAPHRGLLDALPKLTRAARGAPIIITLGTDARANDRTRVLRAGADACFCHPLSFIEMHERLHALCRAIPSAAHVDATSGTTLALDSATRELVCGEQRLDVTRREYMLLECMLRQPNVPVARNQLIRYAWPEHEDVDPTSVNLVVSRLRRKLAQHASNVHIDTVSRYGYQITVARHLRLR
ncbi:winged-helix domain-containing protein [Paraburkholderia sp. SIMBA_054]|uniref:winged helix-turn-helix transcriptional regulator n=1 Tax=Paraburkholderia sp. SIMBA_054 TaxID=3085795 RepID=UPI00397A0F8E